MFSSFCIGLDIDVLLVRYDLITICGKVDVIHRTQINKMMMMMMKEEEDDK